MYLFINNETQYATLLYLQSGFIIYTPSFILGRLFYDEKKTLNLGS